MSIKTLLIGLDGATFSVLDPLMADGTMPFLRRFFTEGTRGNLRTVIPALTPPAWTSLMTGRRPGDHGVFDFFRRETRDGLHIRFFTSNDVGVPTMWSIAAANQLRVTSLNFPAMFPAPKLPGYIVPGWIPWRQLRLACWPSDLFDKLKATLPNFNPKELAMDIGLEEQATEGCADERDLTPWIDLHTRREENWFEIFRVLTEEHPSELTALVFDGVDKLQHLCWRFLRPEDGAPLREEWEFAVRDRCLAYFRRLDSIVEQMCTAAGPQATVVIASDHGFQPSRDVFHANTWLAERGYLAWSNVGTNTNGVTSEKTGSRLGVGQVARHTYQLDWNVTKAFAATPTSNGIYIAVNRDGTSPGILPEEYESFRNRIVEELRETIDPVSGGRIVTGAWKREEIFGEQHRDFAPDITLELHDGGLLSILPSESFISRRPVTAGFHAPIGIFGARGPLIRQGASISELSILDVAPIVLSSLGVPLDADMEGNIPAELYREDASMPGLESRRRYAASSTSSTTAAAMTAEDEQVVLERLRQLGYVE